MRHFDHSIDADDTPTIGYTPTPDIIHKGFRFFYDDEERGQGRVYKVVTNIYSFEPPRRTSIPGGSRYVVSFF